MASESSRRAPRQYRVEAMYGVIAVAFLVLLGQLWNVQIANGPQYQQRAEVNRIRLVSEKATRGVIYDRSGHQVARNVPSFAAAVRPADLPRDKAEQEAMFERLGRVIGMEPDKIQEVVDAAHDDPFTPARVKSGITREQALTIEEQLNQFPGVVVDSTPIRGYPDGELLGQILGYTGPIPSSQLQSRLATGYERNDTLGISGVEAAYEDVLKGSKGRKQVEVDALGRVTEELATLAPTVTGGNLVLTLDTNFQRKATELLSAAMQKAHSEQASLVAISPKTGDVLAMVSLPQYDNNLFADGISTQDYQRLSENPWRPLVNNAIAGQYPAGSTFKLVTAAAALQEKVVTPTTPINCPGAITVNGQTFRDWTPKGHGPNVTARHAIAVSCDIYFYSVAGGNPYTGLKGLGIQKLAEYAHAFGFGEKSGIHLGGEQAGLVPTEEWKKDTKKEGWYIGDNYNVGIGQGDLLVTPLQLADMTAAMANGGTLYRPRIVSAVRDESGKVTQTFAPEVIRKLPVNIEFLNAIRAGMRDAVTTPDGTAYYALKQPALAIAGKTGTAEFYGPRDKNGNLPTHALFVGFAPYDDPQIAVAVFVYHGGEGSEIAAPVAADVMKAYFDLGIQ